MGQPGVWYAVGALALLSWFGMVALAAWRLRAIPKLSPLQGDLPVGEELISVIVPARNEERDIAAALRSILAQQGVGLEVIVVDDHSDDATGRILDDLARTDVRLRVIHAPVLRPGWLGKANAMQTGLEVATGEYILFTDADIIHKPRCFATALTELRRRDYGLISGMPTLQIRLFWEHCMLPMMVAGMTKLETDQAQRPGKESAVVASGALLLLPRDTLTRIGGLETIRNQMADDVALARAVKRSGLTCAYYLAPELMGLQFFKSNREAFSGTAKNILLVIEESTWLAPLIPLFSMLLFWFPFAFLIRGLLQGNLTMAGAGLTAYLLEYVGLFVVRPIFSFHLGVALAFPMVVVLVAWNMGRAYWLHLQGKITWRGRTIQVE